MTWLRAARAIGGLLAIVTLLGLVTADVLFGADALTGAQTALLLAVISALLGVDIITERLPIEVTVKGGPDK